MSKILKSLILMVGVMTMVETSVAFAATDRLETAKTKYIEANGIKFSYRTIGKETGTPLIMLVHFTGTMDYWDPAVVNGLAKERPVIVFNNRGIGHTNGKPSDNVAEMASDAHAFIQALGYKKVDILGFSLGGFVAQELAAGHPELVNKVILVGTSNQGGGDTLLQSVGEASAKKDLADPREFLFFSASEKGQKAAKAFIKRVNTRTKDRDPISGEEVRNAQVKAITTWANTKNDDLLLKAIQQPTLIVQGSNDRMLDTNNSVTMFNKIQNAQLILYPDAGHGSFFEYHDSFVNSANFFLSH